ncbi:MAG: imidazole glycerol phosphate synthase subunit HisH [Tatlockia sp.]|nr:imidazole glycerol phosphate synthase subunit HisH [Tatlockia sp.]
MIAIIDVTGNNLKSLAIAIQKLGYDCQLTHEVNDLQKASHVILPGVGAAPPAMQALTEYELIEPLRRLTKPLLGICLGMQLMFERSEEGEIACLNLIPGKIEHLPQIIDYPVPHMGWSKLQWSKPTALSEGLESQDYFYFVHSYALLSTTASTLATCEYSTNFSAIVQHENKYGMQFHPEKSAEVGLKLLNNFLKQGESC